MLHLGSLVTKVEFGKGDLRHQVERWELLVELLKYRAVVVSHFTINVTCVVSATGADKSVWREELLDLIMTWLDVYAVLIELLLIHVLGDPLSVLMHFYNYNEHH
jgi:hypothetical protein